MTLQGVNGDSFQVRKPDVNVFKTPTLSDLWSMQARNHVAPDDQFCSTDAPEDESSEVKPDGGDQLETKPTPTPVPAKNYTTVGVGERLDDAQLQADQERRGLGGILGRGVHSRSDQTFWDSAAINTANLTYNVQNAFDYVGGNKVVNSVGNFFNSLGQQKTWDDLGQGYVRVVDNTLEGAGRFFNGEGALFRRQTWDDVGDSISTGARNTWDAVSNFATGQGPVWQAETWNNIGDGIRTHATRVGHFFAGKPEEEAGTGGLVEAAANLATNAANAGAGAPTPTPTPAPEEKSTTVPDPVAAFDKSKKYLDAAAGSSSAEPKKDADK